MSNEWILHDDAAPEPTPRQRSRAVRSAAHHARDATELAELLDMLGLSAHEGLPVGARPGAVSENPDTRP